MIDIDFSPKERSRIGSQTTRQFLSELGCALLGYALAVTLALFYIAFTSGGAWARASGTGGALLILIMVVARRLLKGAVQ